MFPLRLVSMLLAAFVTILAIFFIPDNGTHTNYCNNAFAITGSGTSGAGGAFATHGSITGYVRDAAMNSEIMGVRVSALMPDDFRVEALDANTHEIKGQNRVYLTRTQQYIADTRPDGFYAINRVPLGTYKVWVDAMAAGYQKVYYDGAEESSAGIPVEVNESLATSGIDFSLLKGGAISGVVHRSSDGQPIAGLTIAAFLHPNSILAAETTTRADGSYSLTGLFPGQYRVKADGKTDYVSMYFSREAVEGQGSLIAVNINSLVSNIDFFLTAFGSITGKVTQTEDSATPIGGVLVNAYPFPASDRTKSMPVKQGATSQDGSYIINSLPPGSYQIIAKAPNTYAEKIYNGNEPGDFSLPVIVKEGQVTAGIHLALEPGGTLSGFLTDKISGRPLVNARVILFNAESGGETARNFTKATGHYSFNQLQAGTYLVSGHAANHVDAYFNNNGEASQGQPITITAGLIRSDIDFQLTPSPFLPPGLISGVISRNIDGEPLANICISALQTGSTQMFGQDCSAVDGHYIITGLVPGQYRICTKPKTEYVEGCLGANGLLVNQEDATPVSVDGEDPLTGVNISLRKFGRISGTLFRSKDGHPIGTYTLADLEPGFYHIRVTQKNTGYQEEYFNDVFTLSSAASIEVMEDQQTDNIDFNLEVVR